MRWAAGLLLIAVAATCAAGEIEFSLRLDGYQLAPRMDPAREAMLAEWNSPMGRLTFFVNDQYANLLRGGQPGATAAPVIRFRAQAGQPLQLVAAAVDAGVDLSARTLEIPWPWQEDQRPAASMAEQLGEMLGRRIELHP